MPAVPHPLDSHLRAKSLLQRLCHAELPLAYLQEGGAYHHPRSCRQVGPSSTKGRQRGVQVLANRQGVRNNHKGMIKTTNATIHHGLMLYPALPLPPSLRPPFGGHSCYRRENAGSVRSRGPSKVTQQVRGKDETPTQLCLLQSCDTTHHTPLPSLPAPWTLLVLKHQMGFPTLPAVLPPVFGFPLAI